MTAAPGLTLELGLARGLVRALGGVTQKDIADIVRGLAVAGPPGPPGPKGDAMEASAQALEAVVAQPEAEQRQSQ
jgi:hypothetical protein